VRILSFLAAVCAACGARTESFAPAGDLRSATHASPDASLATDAACAWQFAPLVSYVAGSAPVAVTIADLDGDGHPDLAVNNYGGEPGGLTLNTLRNNGDGTFSPWHSYDSGVSFSVAAGPLLSSSSVDLLVGCDLFPNDGVGVFGNAVWYSSSGGCGAQDSYNNLVLADYDGDGRLDFAWALLSPGFVVDLNRGGGSFDEVDVAISHVNPYMDTLAGADFDRDGRPDLVGVSWGYGYPSSIRLFRNTGGGTFAETDISAGMDGLHVVAADDLNDDGWPDLVIDNTTTGMEVLLNRGDGTFGPPTSYAFPMEVRSIAVGDLNGDNVKDVVFGGYGGAALGVFYGRGDGTFSPAVEWSLGNNPWSVALGDLNGDGHADVAVAATGASGSNVVDVLLSQCR
jgi:hypothetical protein